MRSKTGHFTWLNPKQLPMKLLIFVIMFAPKPSIFPYLILDEIPAWACPVSKPRFPWPARKTAPRGSCGSPCCGLQSSGARPCLTAWRFSAESPGIAGIALVGRNEWLKKTGFIQVGNMTSLVNSWGFDVVYYGGCIKNCLFFFDIVCSGEICPPIMEVHSQARRDGNEKSMGCLKVMPKVRWSDLC